MSRKATLLGASGLIGSSLLDILLEDPYYDVVHILVRKSLNIHHPKLTEHVINFEDAEAYGNAISSAETVFCAVGTTLKKVNGDRVAYKKVDYDIPVNAAKMAATQAVFGFILVSSVGANASNNNNFYLKLKGIVEETISKENIPQVHFFRPSLLMGDRSEKRTGESIAQMLAPVFSIFLLGKSEKYKPISAIDVAFAMLAAGKQQKRGIFIHEYADIKKMLPK